MGFCIGSFVLQSAEEHHDLKSVSFGWVYLVIWGSLGLECLGLGFTPMYIHTCRGF